MMDERYLLGIPEIDAQHEDISNLVDSLREVIAREGQGQLVQQALKRLYQTLVTHFAFEDAAMKMVGYADSPQHEKMHKGVLKVFEAYFEHPTDHSDYERLGKLITDKVLGHVTEHDLKMAESVRDYLGKRSPRKGKQQS